MYAESIQNLLRDLPQVEEVLREASIEQLIEHMPRALVTQAVRTAIDEVRHEVLAGQVDVVDIPAIVARAHRLAEASNKRSLRAVINASGVIIHTNLGRSVLAPEAVDAVLDTIHGYSTLEYNVDAMARGERNAHVESLICELTGAQAAIVVNNNAAAVMMVLSEFAAGHEAIVSRGELIEIGGSFRIPDIMNTSGAHMVEVGTTNKTHARDYQNALAAQTAMVLKVHPSNYRMVGFTQGVSVAELKGLTTRELQARAQQGNPLDLLVYEDQGSGVLLDLNLSGDYQEPTVSQSIQQGCDLVSFSGDKLLGGPQAGIIVGRRELIDHLKNNPLARVLRLDKMTLAALEATLKLYLDEETARKRIPTLRMLSESDDVVLERANRLCTLVAQQVSADMCTYEVIREVARAGGGALPMVDIKTRAVALTFLESSATECERYLVQQHEPPIIARIKNGQLLLDARTILNDGELETIAQAIAAYFSRETSPQIQPGAGE